MYNWPNMQSNRTKSLCAPTNKQTGIHYPYYIDCAIMQIYIITLAGIHKKPNAGLNQPCGHHERLEKENQIWSPRKNRSSMWLLALMLLVFKTNSASPWYSYFSNSKDRNIVHRTCNRVFNAIFFSSLYMEVSFRILHFLYVCISFLCSYAVSKLNP